MFGNSYDYMSLRGNNFKPQLSSLSLFIEKYTVVGNFSTESGYCKCETYEK